jgi:hypothetical protein
LESVAESSAWLDDVPDSGGDDVAVGPYVEYGVGGWTSDLSTLVLDFLSFFAAFLSAFFSAFLSTFISLESFDI